MKGGAAKKVAAGFPTDMNMLLERFVATNTVRYEGFAKLWREAKFPLVYCGRKDPREMRLFVDELFHIILQLWVPTSNFQEKVFGLYMLYGMYTMQPLTPKVKIRIRITHWALSQELLQQSAKEQHLDICYIIHRMRLEHTFHYVAFLKLRSPALLAEKEEDKNSISEMSMKVYSNLHDMMKGGLLEQLSLIHDQYTCMRSMQDVPSVSQLDMVRHNIFEDLSREVSKLQAKYRVRPDQEKDAAAPNPAEESDDDSDTSNVGTRRKRLRQRQFASTSQTRKGQRYEELVIDEDADNNSSPDIADKRPKRSRKGASTKAGKSKKSATPNTSVEKEIVEPVDPQKAGKSKRRPTKSKKTAATPSENVGDGTGSGMDNASAEVAAIVRDTAQDRSRSAQKRQRGSGRRKKTAAPRRGQAGKSADAQSGTSKKRGPKSNLEVQPQSKKAKNT